MKVTKVKSDEERAAYQRVNFPTDEQERLVTAEIYAEAAKLREARRQLSESWACKESRENGWTPPQVLVHHHLGNSGRKSVMEAV